MDGIVTRSHSITHLIEMTNHSDKILAPTIDKSEPNIDNSILDTSMQSQVSDTSNSATVGSNFNNGMGSDNQILNQQAQSLTSSNSIELLLQTQSVKLIILATRYLEIYNKMLFFDHNTIPEYMDTVEIDISDLLINGGYSTANSNQDAIIIECLHRKNINYNPLNSENSHCKVPKILFNKKFLQMYYDNNIDSLQSVFNCRAMWQNNQRKEFYKHIWTDLQEIETLFQWMKPVQDVDDALSLMRKDSLLTRKMSTLLHSEGFQAYFVNQEHAEKIRDLLRYLWVEKRDNMTPNEVRCFVKQVFVTIIENSEVSQHSFHVVWMYFMLWDHVRKQLSNLNIPQNEMLRLKSKLVGALSMLRFFISVFWDPFKYNHLSASEPMEGLEVQHSNSRSICDLMKRIVNGGIKQKSANGINSEEIMKNNELIEEMAKEYENYCDAIVGENNLDQFLKVDWVKLISYTSSQQETKPLKDLVVLYSEDAIDLQNYLTNEIQKNNILGEICWSKELPGIEWNTFHEDFLKRIPLTLIMSNKNDDIILNDLEQALVNFRQFIYSRKHQPWIELLSEYRMEQNISSQLAEEIQSVYPYFQLMCEYLEFFNRRWEEKLNRLHSTNESSLLPKLQNELSCITELYESKLESFGNMLNSLYEKTKHTKIQKKMKITSEMLKEGYLFSLKYKHLLEYGIVVPDERFNQSEGTSFPKHIIEFYKLPNQFFTLQLRIRNYSRKRRLSVIQQHFPIIGGHILDINELLERIIENGETIIQIRGDYSIDIPKLLKFLHEFMKS